MFHTIRSLEDLQALASNLNGDYALGGSIDASATAGWNGGAGFVPIGTPARPFTGSFDGRGHVIRGLFIHRPGENHVGLFGYARNATLRNLGLVAGSIQGGGNVGGLVGYHGAGDGGTASITHAYATGQVRGTADNVGGLVGHSDANGGTAGISHAYASGPVSGRDGTGGLVGHSEAHRGTARIANAYASGRVTSSGSNVGGLVGHNEAFSGAAGIANAYAMGRVAGRDYVGGLVGYNDALQGSVNISETYASGAVTATGEIVGGLVGWNANGRIERSFYATTDVDAQPINRGASSAGQGKTLDALKQRSTFAGWSLDDQDGGNATWRIHEGKTTPLLRGLLP